MKKILLFALMTIVSCTNKTIESKGENKQDTIANKKISLEDSIIIYTKIRNKNKIIKVQSFLDSIKKVDPDKYKLMKILILENSKELFEAEIYGDLKK